MNFIQNTFCVDETAKHTDVETDEVKDAVLIIPPNHHSQVGDQDVLKTTNDGCGQGGIELGADHLNTYTGWAFTFFVYRCEDENESKSAGEKKLCQEPAVLPALKI